MPQITLREWRLTAGVEDTDILKLNVESTDGSDIIEMGAGNNGSRTNEPYVLRFSTETIESAQQSGRHRQPETEDEEAGPGWEIDDEETVYTRGWEVNALVDEDGVLAVEIVRQDDAEVYVIDPVESGVPQPSPVVLRLGAEEEADEDDEDEDEEEEEDLDEELGDYDELDEGAELDDYYDTEESDEELEDFDALMDEAEEDY